MHTKRLAIVALVGVNVALLAALLFQTLSLPQALAQVGARPGGYAAVTAKPAGQSYEVLYLLDVPSRQLHALYPSVKQRGKLVPVPPRDLAKDFATN